MSKHESIEHRHHAIKTMRNANGYRAQAFRAGKPVGDVETGETEEAAVLAIKAFLDQRAADLRSRRRNGFPCADEIRAALPSVAINKAQEAMLLAHFNASDHILTATELAQAAGYEDYNVANRQYGQLAHDLAQELDWTPEEKTNGVTTWTFMLADDADKSARAESGVVPKQWRWQLRPEVVEALS